MAITRVGGSWIHKYVSLVADDVTHTYTRAAKPELNLPNGSRCFEMDSDTEYIYDRENDAWEVYVPSSSGGEGTTNYNQLSNKPSINNVVLSGNKTLDALGINAGSIGFNETETYTDGSVGAEVLHQKNAIDQLDTQADTQDLLSNMDTGMVNYQYDTYYKRVAVPSASDSTKLGVERNKQLVTLNGGGLNGDIIVRLTNTVATTIVSSTVKRWSSTFQLLDGHYYVARIKYLSGTQSVMRPSISIYKTGSASTSGSLVYSDDYEYARSVIGDGGYYNICLYVTAGYSFENAQYLVTLEDLTAKEDDNFDYFDGRINRLHNMVKYYGDTKITLAATGSTASYTSVGVERLGTVIKLNYAGNGTSSHTKRVRINGMPSRADGNDYTSWPRDLQLVEGQEYRFKIKKLSGSSSLMNGNAYFPTLVAYKTGVNTTITTQVISEPGYGEYSFVAPTGGLVLLCIYMTNNAVLTDLVVEVTLEEYHDESAPIADYYVAEAADTIAKVRDEITSPSMVFLWATDIHRMSSNAAVQTFSKMIANMAYVSKAVPCDFILCTGDLTDGDQAKDTTLSRAYDCMTDFRSIGVPFVWAQGNHDNNPYISSGSLVLSLPECYKAYFESAEGSYNASENGTEYYIDFDRLNTRLISLNANNSSANIKYAYGQSTATWLASALDTDKNIIITLHQSPITSQVYDNTSTDGAAAIRSAITTFVNGGGNVIMLSGHSHNDIAFVSPYLSIMQDCQRFSDLAEDVTDQAHGMSGFIDVVRKCARVQNTATEDLWSVGVYKPDANELSLIRFGAGKDRYFHVTPIAPTTLTSKLSGTLTWSSSNDAVATVADGVVTGEATGRCAVLAHDESDNYECWIVEVA